MNPELESLFAEEKPSDLAKRLMDPEEKSVETKPVKQRPSAEDNTARTVFIGNLLNTTKKKEVKALVSPYGSVETIRFRNVELDGLVKLKRKLAIATGKIKPDGLCSAYVVMKTPEEARAALELNGKEFNGHVLRVDAAGKPGEKKKIPREMNMRTAFIGQLSYDTTEDQLREIFADCGEIDHVRIPKDKDTGKGRGIAYVTFKDQEAMEYALKFDKVKLNKREISVSVSKPPKEINTKEARSKGTSKKAGFQGKKAKEQPGNKSIKSYIKKANRYMEKRKSK